MIEDLERMILDLDLCELEAYWGMSTQLNRIKTYFFRRKGESRFIGRTIFHLKEMMTLCRTNKQTIANSEKLGWMIESLQGILRAELIRLMLRKEDGRRHYCQWAYKPANRRLLSRLRLAVNAKKRREEE